MVLWGIVTGIPSTFDIAGSCGQLAVAENAQHADETHTLAAGSTIALGVMTLLSLALGWGWGRVLRPLRVMTVTTWRISADSLHERLDLPGPHDDLKDLADTIDGLLERLDGSFAAQRRFVANAAHELRTPLATIRASLHVAVAKPIWLRPWYPSPRWCPRRELGT